MIFVAETTEAAAAIDWDEDASTTAATKDEEKRKEVMSESQENKNGKISERDDEIRRLVEERRNIAKGEKHKLKYLSERIKKMHQRK